MAIVIQEDERGMSYYLCSDCGKPVTGLPFVVFCDDAESCPDKDENGVCTGHGYCDKCEKENKKVQPAAEKKDQNKIKTASAYATLLLFVLIILAIFLIGIYYKIVRG